MFNTTLLVGVFAQQVTILTLFAIAGYIAFSGIADKFAAAKLPKEAKTGKDALMQVLKIVTLFVVMLSVTYLAMCLGLPFKMLILALCLVSSQRFIDDILGQVITGFFTRRALSISMSTTLNLGWYFYPNWVTIDLAALLVCMHMLIAYRNITIKQSAIVSFGIMGYDAMMVFGTGLMQKVAAGATTSGGGKVLVPVLVMIPKTMSWNSDRLFMLGLGDIILPGFIVMCAIRLAVKYNTPSLAIGAWLGYVAGTVAALLMVFSYHHPQPATIYLMPGAFAGLMIAAWVKGLAKKVLLG